MTTPDRRPPLSSRVHPERAAGPSPSGAGGTAGADDWDRIFDPDALVEPEPPVEPVNVAEPTAIRYLGFRLGNEHYAVPIVDLAEVVRRQEITYVPRLRPFVLGIISVRGTIVPILDLRRRMAAGASGTEGAGEPAAAEALGRRRAGEQSGQECRILVTRAAGDPFGILVDAVSDVFSLEPAAVEPPPPTLPKRLLEFVAGIARVGGQVHLLLHLQSVLTFATPIPTVLRQAEVAR
jgi:purine-binding chemotaxis protein CheW